MQWLPKLHETPIGARSFIIASKNCSTKPPSEVTFKVFKMNFNVNVETFHAKRFTQAFKSDRL